MCKVKSPSFSDQPILFLKTRRNLIEYLLNMNFIEQNKITGKGLLKAYRELSYKLFCLDVFRDNCYEKYWKTGYEVGYKQASDNDAIPETSAPANALSRMCGEVALLHKEGYFKKIDRGIYSINALPVHFQVRKASIEEVAGELASDVFDEARKAASRVRDTVDRTVELTKIATAAAIKAVQEELKKA